MPRKRSQLGKRVVVASALAVIAAITVALVSSRGEAGGSPMPTVSALDRLPAIAVTPPAVERWTERLAARGHTGDAVAVRQLRVNLGSRKTGVYGLRDGRGGVCFLYLEFAGTCSKAGHLRQTGIQWTLGAGVFVALVTDDVKRVALAVDDEMYAVSLVNNIAFAEYEKGNSASISVTYANGATETSDVRLDGPLLPAPPN